MEKFVRLPLISESLYITITRESFLFAKGFITKREWFSCCCTMLVKFSCRTFRTCPNGLLLCQLQIFVHYSLMFFVTRRFFCCLIYFLIEVSSPSLYWNRNHKRNRPTVEELPCNTMQYCLKSYVLFNLSIHGNRISALNDCLLVNLGVFFCLSAMAVGLPSHLDRWELLFLTDLFHFNEVGHFYSFVAPAHMLLTKDIIVQASFKALPKYFEFSSLPLPLCLWYVWCLASDKDLQFLALSLDLLSQRVSTLAAHQNHLLNHLHLYLNWALSQTNYHRISAAGPQLEYFGERNTSGMTCSCDWESLYWVRAVVSP